MDPARFPNGIELRAAAELRAVAGRRLEGYAAVFNTPAPIGRFTETIRAGAFRASLLDPSKDVLALVDHDPGRLLARTSSGTLRLTEDAKGLRFEIDVPDTSIGRDVLTMAERRDLGGMSFAFTAISEAWPKPDQRELRALTLHEISIIHAHPAYPQTSIAARARAVDAAAAVRRRILDMS